EVSNLAQGKQHWLPLAEALLYDKVITIYGGAYGGSSGNCRKNTRHRAKVHCHVALLISVAENYHVEHPPLFV
ncbi:MAG: hypothetical protein RR213_07340, partial [Raoultibacter sp.]